MSLSDGNTAGSWEHLLLSHEGRKYGQVALAESNTLESKNHLECSACEEKEFVFAYEVIKPTKVSKMPVSKGKKPTHSKNYFLPSVGCSCGREFRC